MRECLDTGKKSAEEIQHFKLQFKGKIKQTKEGERKRKKKIAENFTANVEVKNIVLTFSKNIVFCYT